MADLSVINKLLMAFVTLLVGVILIGTVATEGLGKTEKTIVLNEQHALVINDGSINETYNYTVNNPPTSWKITDCPITNLEVMNGTDDIAFTEGVDYYEDLTAGTFYFQNSSTTVAMIGDDNSTYVNYDYCGDDYMNLGWGRTSINLIAGFFAIAILMVSLGLFYSVAKETGLL
jgi:hypothetical protein